MKKRIYISAFILLGILLQFLIHGAVEIWYIERLLTDYETYGLGISWHQWIVIHNIASVLLFAAGVSAGAWQGVRWWKKRYTPTA